MQSVYLQRIIKKNAAKGYEKTNPKQTQFKPNQSLSWAQPALSVVEWVEWANFRKTKMSLKSLAKKSLVSYANWTDGKLESLPETLISSVSLCKKQ